MSSSKLELGLGGKPILTPDLKTPSSLPLFLSFASRVMAVCRNRTEHVGLVRRKLLEFYGLVSPNLEKEMATHSSILAWRIPCSEEPGGLEPMGSQRVGHK